MKQKNYNKVVSDKKLHGFEDLQGAIMLEKYIEHLSHTR